MLPYLTFTCKVSRLGRTHLVNGVAPYVYLPLNKRKKRSQTLCFEAWSFTYFYQSRFRCTVIDKEQYQKNDNTIPLDTCGHL